MAFDRAEIRFDTNPAGVFYAGQLITGSVLFELEQRLNISVLYMQFLGEANVSWTENETKTVDGVQEENEIRYIGHEEYFNSIIQLAGGSASTSNLLAGAQDFPFQFQIPFTAPSSFKGEHGGVFYSITVHLLYADPSVGKPRNDKISKNFEVIAPFDLNAESTTVGPPLELNFDEAYGCGCFCTPYPVKIRVRLPVSGYCPGQTIPVSVELENESSVEITKIMFQIISTELYRSQRPPAEYTPPEIVLATVSEGPFEARSKKNFECELLVPDMIAPDLDKCNIIDLRYIFRVIVKPSGYHEELKDQSTLFIGLVPLREFTEGEYVHPLADSLPTGPIPVFDRDSSPLASPPVNTSPRSNVSLLNRYQSDSVSQNSPPAEIGLYADDPPSYSSLAKLYPNEIKFKFPKPSGSKAKPSNDYEMGDRQPARPPSIDIPHSSNVSNATQHLYPIVNVVRSVSRSPVTLPVGSGESDEYASSTPTSSD